MRASLGLALLGAGYLAASSVRGEETSRAAAEESVRAFYRAWTADTAARGAEGAAAAFAPDAVLLPPGEAPAVGRQAIHAWFARTLREAPEPGGAEGAREDELRIVADRAIRRTTRVGEGVETKYLDVLERTAEGWRFSHRMWNSSSPPAARAGGPAPARDPCAEIGALVEAGLGLAVSRDPGSRVEDPLAPEGTGEHEGCRIRAEETASEWLDPIGRLGVMLVKWGWRELPRYSADGPDGSAMGYERGGERCVVRASWDGGDDEQPERELDPGYRLEVICFRAGSP